MNKLDFNINDNESIKLDKKCNKGPENVTYYSLKYKLQQEQTPETIIIIRSHNVRCLRGTAEMWPKFIFSFQCHSSF